MREGGPDKWRVLSIGLSVSLSAIMFGYSLKEITSIPVDTISANYGISLDPNLLQGLLIAIMPFGGLFGSLIAKSFLKSITRLRGMHLALPVLVLSILIVQITTPTTLFVGRFLEGGCIGYYVSIAPIYLKEISPKQMRSVTGTFFGLGKIVGVLTVILLELLLGEEAWRILLSVTAILALMQSAALAVIGVDTPYEWIARGDFEKAREAVQYIYHKEDVEDVLEEIKKDIQLEIVKSETSLDLQANESFKKKKSTAFYVALNVCVLRHFSGGNSLITSAGIIMNEYSKDLAKWTPLVINSTQLIALTTYILFFSHALGKRFLIVNSSALLALLNVALIASLIFESEVGILLSIMAFMMVYGGMLLSAVWSYPSEIIPASESLIPNTVHWIALSLSTLAPSLVMSVMPNNEVYPCFLFFFAYSFFAFIYFQGNVVDSNGLTYQEIILRFK